MENLQDQTAFWLSKQLKVNKSAMYRYLKANNLKAMPMKDALSVRWTGKMITKLRNEYPKEFTKELAERLGVSPRTVIRKARELGICKEEDFLTKNRKRITEKAVAAHPPTTKEVIEANLINGGKKTRFKKGNHPKSNSKKVWQTRRLNEQKLQYLLKHPY